MIATLLLLLGCSIPVNASKLPLERLEPPSSLVGNPEFRQKVNHAADEQGLPRLRNGAERDFYIRTNYLVRVPEKSRYFAIDHRLFAKKRYCHSCALRLLEQISKEFQVKFGRKLQVNSLNRTVIEQEALKHRKRGIPQNGNAAPADGGNPSLHLLGTSLDIAKDAMTGGEIEWMRTKLPEWKQKYRFDGFEEHAQAVFHFTALQGCTPPKIRYGAKVTKPTKTLHSRKKRV